MAYIFLVMTLPEPNNAFKAFTLKFRYSLELGMGMGDMVMVILSLKVMDLVKLLHTVLICMGELLRTIEKLW